MVKDLENLSTSFLKLSGLLKVPEALTAEVQDFIIKAYSAYHAQKIKDYLLTAQKKTKHSNEIISNINKWEISLNKIATYQITLQEVEKLVIDQSFPDIYFLHYSGSWPNKTLDIDYLQDSLHFAIFKKKDKYVCDLMINIPDGENKDGLKYFKIEDSQYLTHDEALSWLDKNIENLYKAFYALSNLTSTLQYDDPSGLRDLNITREVLLKHKKDMEYSHLTISKMFTVSTKDLPYQKFTPFTQIQFHANFINDSKKQGVHRWDWAGIWNPNDTLENGYIGDLTVAKNSPISEFYNFTYLDDIFDDLRKTTRHEVQHLIQTFLEFATNQHHAGGPSNKLQDPNYTFEGQGRHPPLHRMQDHDLRDVEFYTDLTDSIQDFNRFKTSVPIPLHKIYAALWTGQISLIQSRERMNIYLKNNPKDESRIRSNMLSWEMSCRNGFFHSLSKAPQEKLSKAVREFWKAVFPA